MDPPTITFIQNLLLSEDLHLESCGDGDGGCQALNS